MNFIYYNPVKIHFGVNFLDSINFINERKILLVTSQGFSKRGVTKELQNALLRCCVGVIDSISPNPQLYDLLNLKANLREFDAILALGGGSVMDSAKFFAANKIVVQNGEIKLAKNALTKPIYAIPTTAGTSSELTKWATIWDNATLTKHSLSDEKLYPKAAFYDANLALSLPRETTIFTALDALSHACESIWNNNANPISTHFALNAIKIILRDLPPLSENLHSLPLRTSLMQASIYAGLAFSNTQTALAHALSYPLTMKFGTPHGLACSFSLPILLDCLPQSKAKEILTPFKTPLNALFESLKISKNPRDYGLDSALIDEIFATLNARAKNGIFDLQLVKTSLKQSLS